MCRGYGSVQEDILAQLREGYCRAMTLKRMAGDANVESYRRAAKKLEDKNILTRIPTDGPGARFGYLLTSRLSTFRKRWGYPQDTPTNELLECGPQYFQQ